MKARLAVISGLLQGETVALAELPLSIGRNPANGLRLAEGRVSRFHCEVDRRDDAFLVRDLGSTHGTFVNGSPVREQIIDQGDQISIGSTVLVLLLDDSSPERVTLRFEEDTSGQALTTQLSVHQLRPPEFEQARQWAGGLSAGRDLRTLLEMTRAINSIASVSALMARLLDLLFKIVPAEAGSILLGDSVDSINESHARWPRGRRPELTVSRTLLSQAMSAGNALLCADLQRDELLQRATSLANSKAMSVVCVPLKLYDRTLGALYLQTQNPLAPFTEHHLRLAAAVASSAAVALENARHIEWLRAENRRLKKDLGLQHELVGASPAMASVLEFISRVAPTGSTVLISGENGTGKELVARAIHLNSERAERPCVAINCATLAEGLLESELFGHERGAFTGAVARKEGKLEVADRGTLLLDEVAELAPTLQSKLLRVLQELEFERVGGTRPIRVDVRVIASTNRDLKEAVEQGHFRRDLYHRLNVVAIEIPPLRSRKDDIALLTQHFLRKCAPKCRRSVIGVSARARAALQAYDWPGNVRELENAIERALVLGSTDEILLEDLPAEIADCGSHSEAGPSTYQEELRAKKRELVRQALRESAGNFTRAAKTLGLHPNYLHRLVNSLDLRRELHSED